MFIEKSLIIGEDSSLLESLQQYLSPYVGKNSIAYSAIEGIKLIKETFFSLIICEKKLQTLSGLEVLEIAKRLHPNSLLILLASKEIAASSFPCITKPITQESLHACLQQAFPTQEDYLIQGKYPFIANSPKMKELFCQILKIAKSNASVFITGESGTGKEVIASAIHHYSTRFQKPFIKVNCAAIPDSLLESEFFGHEKGSFTGALQKRIGRFELADKGTLLLDEISEIPLELQPKLLRSIQEQEFERVGGMKPVQVDVRLISTSNRDMKETVEKKLFREDLYFRLHVVPLKIPPLRERKEDILPLAYFFLTLFCKENGKITKTLSEEAKNSLLSYYWPGNVRELANVMERTVVIHTDVLIQTEDLGLELFCKIPQKATSWISPGSLTPLAEVEKIHILETLKTLGNNKDKTAKNLGISPRTLRNKLKIYEKS